MGSTENEIEKGAHMRKFFTLIAALAVAVAVQTPQRAIAQTAPASKDANETISLTAQQKKPSNVRRAGA